MHLQLKQKKTGLKIISIIMSLLLWAYVVNQGSDTSGQNLLQVSLDYRHVPPGLTVQGPEQVAVRLWGVLQKNATVKAYVDLSNYEPGTFDVPVQLEPGSGAILTSIQPRRVQVQLISVQEHVFTISHQVLRGPPEGYELLDISVTPDKCLIKGEEATIRKIDHIVGQVDLSQATNMTAYTVNLLPRDADGKLVSGGIELLPRQATIHAVIAPKQASREVPVTVITAGRAASGFQVTSVSAQPGLVKIMGNSSIVMDVGDIKTELVDLTDKRASFQQEAALQAPQGLRIFPARVTVNVTIGTSGINEGQ
ncbi:MAG: YbbR-like domain-containing protein [Syntrophomonadaceae bacterium]|jgi:YbbR domain-containing protein